MTNPLSTLDPKLQQRIAALSPEQRALFEQRLREQQARQSKAVAESATELSLAQVAKTPRPEHLPLSAAQTHLWVLDQLDPNSSAYNIPMAWRLTGQVNLPALARSLSAIVDRHESLRSRFTQGPDALPHQVIGPSPDASGTQLLPVVDLRQQPAPEQEAEQQVQQAAQQPFDLELGPLFRYKLFLVSDRLSILSLTLHHITADGWSRGILLQEIALFYRAFCQDLDLSEAAAQALLPALTAQYADFARWQQDWLKRDSAQQQLDYWTGQLADLPRLELPVVSTSKLGDSEASGIASSAQSVNFESQTCQRSLPVSCAKALKALSRQEGSTLFMTLLSAFNLLLYRYSAQTDIGVGIPVAARNQVEVEPLIGFFVNTLVVRSQLSGQLTFQELLKQVRQTTAAAFQHQELPFAKVVEAIQPERSLGSNPLFQVMFQLQTYQLQNAQRPDLALPELELEQLWVDPGQTKFEMTWHALDRADELLLVVEYRRDRFSADFVEQMLVHFEQLLQEITAYPQHRLADFTLLTSPEYRQIVQDWNQTAQPLPEQPFVHHWFESQVEKTPDAIALRAPVNRQSVEITYQDLNQRANQLAQVLIARGIGPEDLIGLCLERSIDMVVALLGILKAGAAYLPLDPGLPTQRLWFILQDAQPALLLTHAATNRTVHELADAALQPSLEQHHYPPIFCLTQDCTELHQASAENPQISLVADDVAYVIYTSGSTGTPKGTLIPHLGLYNYLHWATRHYPFVSEQAESGDVAQGTVAQGTAVQSSLGFDATITSLYGPLLTGGTVELLPEGPEIATLNQALQASSSEQSFGLLKLTPAHLRGLEPLVGEQTQMPAALVLGGEALTWQDVQPWLARFPSLQLVNEYGPTETVVGCCIYEVDSKAEQPLLGSIPIGRPIENVQLYVLDSDLNPVPVGVPGELYIGGAGLAKGYLNRPELTAERFIPNPFETELSDRLYRSGDRARYRADGVLEYLGRCDDQIKLRGFRIEPGEITAQLRQHPQIAQAEVLVHQSPAGTPQLIAYVVPHSAWAESVEQPSVSEADALPQRLKTALAEVLPSYMLPSQILVLDEFPLTTNGKVNRAALPKPQGAGGVSDAIVAPRTDVEEKLLLIWRSLLQAEQISIHDNFFELGGDSILGMQIIARANQAGLQLKPRQLFEHQTIAELATVTTQLEDATTVSNEPLTGSLPLLPIQADFFAQQLPNSHHFNQAVMLVVDEQIQFERLHQALQALWVHHDGLRLHFESVEGQWQQHYGSPESGEIPLTQLDLSQVPAAEQSEALASATLELQQSFDLNAGPLFRAALIQFGAGEATRSARYQGSRLLLIGHHLLVDGVSWRVLLGDLALVYQQVMSGEAIALPAKGPSLKDWAHQLQQYAQQLNSQPEAQSYWLKSDSSAALPVDYPSNLASPDTVSDKPVSSNAIAHQAQVEIHFTREQTSQLLQDLPKLHQVQINDILLTALAQSISQWTRSKTVRLDLESHGRDDRLPGLLELDLSRTIGWLTSLFPVDLAVPPGGLTEQLQSVKAQLRQVPHQGLGYGVLKHLTPKPLTGHPGPDLAAPAQICFNYLGQVDIQALDPTSGKPSFALGLAPESSGPLRDPQGESCYLLDIVALVSEGQLKLTWRYSQKLYQQSTIEQLAQRYKQAILSLLADCQPQAIVAARQSPQKAAPTNFSATRVDSAQLNKLMGKLQKRGGRS